MTHRFRLALAAVLIGLASSALAIANASAQSFPTQGEFEVDQTRRELERIIADDPEEAANARKTLDALSEPGTSGRRMRNRIAERSGRRIVNGLPATGYSAVGALLVGRDPRGARPWCTGTLVGCDKFLTAAHCVFENDNPKAYWVFFQDLGFFEVTDIRWPNQEYKQPYASYDLAMLTLARPVDGIAPMPINMNTGAKPLNKSIATIVGFGRTGGAREDYGIRRIGSARTEACQTEYAGQRALCWRFDADVKAKRSRSNTCNGDSGGGVFMLDHDGQKRVQKVFGVVSGGIDTNCLKNDESYNVDVAQFGGWLEQAGEGRLSSRQCGGNPVDTEPKRALIRLGGNREQEMIRLDIADGTQKLRVAMNGEDDGSGNNDFDLFVYHGTKIADVQPVCAEAGPGQFAFCEIAQPEPGAWSILVKRKKGSGDVQITATTIGPTAVGAR